MKDSRSIDSAITQIFQRKLPQKVVSNSAEHSDLTARFGKRHSLVGTLTAKIHGKLTPRQCFSQLWKPIGMNDVINIDTADHQHALAHFIFLSIL